VKPVNARTDHIMTHPTQNTAQFICKNGFSRGAHTIHTHTHRMWKVNCINAQGNRIQSFFP